MIKFLLVVYFHDTKNHESIFIFLNNVSNLYYIILYIYIVYAPQYPTRRGIETIREYLETRFDKSILSNSLCNLASIILKNNYFENGDLKYHHKRGFASGTKFAPPYSNLFMTGLKKRVFQNNEFKPFLWLQYLDEIFGMWTQGSQKLNELFNCINSLHPTIKFTIDYSITEVNFLGVTVTKVGNRLETGLYCKPNNTLHAVPSCTINHVTAMCIKDLLHIDRF